MQVRSATISNPLTVAPTASLVEFVDTVLATNQTTAVVISDHAALLGVVSVHDIFRKILPHYLATGAQLTHVLRDDYFADKFVRFQHIAVSEIMCKRVDTLSPDDAVIRAVDLFVRKRRKMIPVVDGEAFLGIITRRSLLRALRNLPP